MPASFQQSLEDWSARLLDGYTERLTRAPAAAKEFNDPVWGTILMRPAEVVVLDSPLVQRLRHVSQLGVVHFLYPAAGHSRLEHTFGVVHQVSRLIASLNEHYTGGGEAIDARQENLLRLTALCHDLGHGALSHVSENALKTLDPIEDVILEFVDNHEAEDAAVAVAEIASYYIVGSPAFAALLGKAQALVPDHGLPNVEDTVKAMRCAIVGKAIDERVPLLHELISGPFDADKLDYMTRDAEMAGVPVVTDIPRLVQKVRAVEVAKGDLPREIGRRVEGDHPYYVVTGIAVSGARTVDELILGRTLQEDKLYRHHKVRAIEAMVASLYRQLTEIEPEAAPMLPFELTDNDFVSLGEERLAAVLGREPNGDELGPAAVAIDLADRLRRRDLFVRAYAFSAGMPLDPYRADAEHYTGLERFSRECANDFARRGEVVEAIVAEMVAAIEIAEPDLLQRYPDPKPYVWLDPVYAAPEANDSARAYLISEYPGTDRVIRFQDDYAETVRWANAYILTRDLGYVFTPADLADYVYVATEKVLRQTYGIRTPQMMQMYAKRSDGRLSELKGKLVEADFYQGLPYDLRPLPERLRKADVRERIEKVCRRLAGYEGPVRGGDVAKRHSLLSPERVMAWLRQFPPELGDGPLRLLERMRLVGREDVVGTLRGFLGSERGAEFSGGAVCPLGAPKDSSAVIAYWAGDAAVEGLRVLSLPEALAKPERPPIVFVEDFIGSGKQSVSILEAWLGEEQTYDLGEEREALDPTVAAQLRERRLAFVFAAGDPDGKRRLRERVEELGLDASVHVGSTTVPRTFEEDGADSDLEQFCRRVGYELLLDPRQEHDEEWASTRALGYGNRAFLVLFGYNTPSQTLTCVWQDGEFEGLPWTSLFPRRKKL